MAKTVHSPRDHAVIIGAGIAGLAAAIRLCAMGLRVTLLERHTHLGGKIRTTPSAAGPVDAGPTVLTMRHVFDDLFATAGTRLEEHVTLIPQEILARHFWPDGSQLDLFADRSRSIDAVKHFAGDRAAQEFSTFSARAATLFEAFDAPMMRAPEPKLGRLVQHVFRHPHLIPSMAPFSSLAGLLRSQFSDPRLRQLFGRYATYVGGAPHLSPAVLALIWHAEEAGVWVVKGGMHKLAEALGTLATQLGVEIRTSAHVERIEVQNGAACGVLLPDGTRISADLVVSAGDPRALATGALGKTVTPVAAGTLKAKRSFSARVHSFSARVTGPDLAHHNVFFADPGKSEFTDLVAGRIPENPTLYLCAEDRGQDVMPAGLERFEMIANAPAANDTQEPEGLTPWNQRIMTRMATFGVRFSPTPEAETVTTPQTFAQMFPASQGALYGQSPHGLFAAFQRPTARTTIPGLYLCGGGAHPGAGVPMATLSAQHLAGAIWNDRISTSRSPQTAMHGGMSTA